MMPSASGAPYVPGRAHFYANTSDTDPARPTIGAIELASARKPALTVTREVVAIVRDVLLIALLVAVMVVGGRALAAVHDVQQQIEQPAVAPLPGDECGGGQC